MLILNQSISIRHTSLKSSFTSYLFSAFNWIQIALMDFCWSNCLLPSQMNLTDNRINIAYMKSNYEIQVDFLFFIKVDNDSHKGLFIWCKIWIGDGMVRCSNIHCRIHSYQNIFHTAHDFAHVQFKGQSLILKLVIFSHSQSNETKHGKQAFLSNCRDSVRPVPMHQLCL